MAVKFLSESWADALRDALNASEVFRQAAAGQRATIQQVITTADGETHYWISLDDGKVDLGLGDAPAADATITSSYDTATAMARSELSPVTAFMIGKIKIAGNMGLLLGLQGALAQLPEAMASIDTDY